MTLFERARRYLRRLHASIEGDSGDRQLYLAALHLIVGFGLDEDTALDLLAEYNSRRPDQDGLGGCWPRWPQERIVYKIEQASIYAEDHPDEVGYLLDRGMTAGSRSASSRGRMQLPTR